MRSAPRESVATAALIARAEAAVALAGTDPHLALAEARAVLAELPGPPEPRAEAAAPYEESRSSLEATGGPRVGTAFREAVSVALRASALAARELGDLALAEERLRQAIEVGEGFPRRVAQAQMSLVTIQAQLGDPEGALRLADLAEGELTGGDLARLGVQRSVALMVLGRHQEAVGHCHGAIESLDEDPKFQAGALLNRGIAYTFLEEYGSAEADLSRCAEIARAAGLDHVAMLAEGNLPFVAARQGDIPAAFERYQAAEAALLGYPERLAAMRADFAEALVAARLPLEARALLEQAVPDLLAAGARASLPDARLSLAQVWLLTGDLHQARAMAEDALSELAAQGRAAWTPLATEVLLRARLAQETPSGELLSDLLSCASSLADGGWATASSALRLTAAETAWRLGDRATARTQLDSVARSATRPVVRHHAQAMRLHLDGDHSGALDAARAGLETLHHPPDRPGGAAMAEPELRAHAARPAEELAAFGLKVAMESGDAWTVLTWAERWRSIVRGTSPSHLSHLESPRASPPGKPCAAPPGKPCAAPPGKPCAAPPGNPCASPPGKPHARPLAEGSPLAGSLVELVRNGDDLAAVVVTSQDRALRPLGSYAATTEATVRVRYGLRRRNLQDSEAADGLARELAALDRQLLAPLGLPDGPVVIVPTGTLCTLPWPLLPSLRGRPLSVASEAASWLARRLPVTSQGPSEVMAGPHGPAVREQGSPLPMKAVTEGGCGPLVVAVAGPGLTHAGAEADMVVRAHPRGSRINATGDEVLAALERADVVHVAAHGMFSPRSPMLSKITLGDGPLMAYDLLRLRTAPRLVVLSACDAGMAHAPVDGIALGLAGAFLDRGSASVVAGVVPVRDDEALTLMTLFHALLADGRSPAEALGAAADKTGIGGFVCFGAGDEPLTRPVWPSR
ncbi:CHAT domain-containing protein [Planotetraspora sp. A-T 1434]|uniref:CHAT domain-containing protein n=1 Tax=Planotetraspora sp. A-T 1434 TaxID=2979219 RepID=UPI0021C24F17|nr:CHAT domain-containing protein [Planotetraspora sp. A-T 1434]MCT9931143.1 CHAT domain-containing protein [Planotetraspora sp. A-T 1434]